jgi:N-carbamoyl-L-amino-acid hydrolase
MNRRHFSQSLLGATLAPGLVRQGSGLRVDGARINQHLAELSQFGKNPQGGVSRVAYTEFDRQGREAAVRWMREAGLEVTIDAAANLVGRRAGRDSSLKPIVLGSHIDSVPEGGNYDGDVGSLSAIEVARALSAAKVTLRHPLEVMIFSNEEGGTIGSHALADGLSAATLDRVAQSGKTIREGIRFLGGDPDRLDSVKRSQGDIAAYLELHIEQGGTLEASSTPIGIVQGIVAIDRYEAVVRGIANHAGTTPMPERHDALVAASHLVLAVREIVTREPGRQVGTVGQLSVSPNAPNVIPGEVRHTIELRDLSAERIARLAEEIRGRAAQIAQATGVRIDITRASHHEAALAHDVVQDAVGRAATDLGLATRRLPSGAGHDAQSMARLGPMGMIFVPSVGGVSHSPKELTSWTDCARGVMTLAGAVLAMDRTAVRS